LWNYKIVEEESEKDNQQTKAFRKVNNLLRNDERVEINMLDISDGITIVRKKIKLIRNKKRSIIYFN